MSNAEGGVPTGEAQLDLAGLLLDVRELTIGFPAGEGLLLAADGVNFQVAAGSTVGLVGESGCGKSVTLRSLVGLVPYPGEVLAGEIRWRGQDIRDASKQRLGELRGREISMIFQDPTSCLNPVFTVGDQITETLRKRAGLAKGQAKLRAVELLDRVGVPSAARRLHSYPHELSGGMRQRVMIAIAVSTRPKLLLADEPTTALDVTIQQQILSLLQEFQEEDGMAIVLVSHDLGVISETCDEVVVMYAGRVLEAGANDAVMLAPRHPYTRGLIQAMPSLEVSDAPPPAPIAGQPPNLADLPSGCPFAPRCEFSRPECATIPVVLDLAPAEHGSACPFVGASA
jgi:oligopeptide/dipeptide ABC transporter ATP-binding protein